MDETEQGYTRFSAVVHILCMCSHLMHEFKCLADFTRCKRTTERFVTSE